MLYRVVGLSGKLQILRSSSTRATFRADFRGLSYTATRKSILNCSFRSDPLFRCSSEKDMEFFAPSQMLLSNFHSPFDSLLKNPNNLPSPLKTMGNLFRHLPFSLHLCFKSESKNRDVFQTPAIASLNRFPYPDKFECSITSDATEATLSNLPSDPLFDTHYLRTSNPMLFL